MSSDSSREQSSPSSGSYTPSLRPILHDPVPLSGDETQRPSHDILPVPSTSTHSSRSYSGAVCRGTVSNVSDSDAMYVESVIGDSAAPSTFRDGLEWESDMGQAQITFEQHSTLEVALKSAVFESFEAFATFLQSLAATQYHSITLDIGKVDGPLLDSSTPGGLQSSMRLWRSVNLHFMNPRWRRGHRVELQCAFAGQDATSTLDMSLCTDIPLVYAKLLGAISRVVALDGIITLASNNIGSISNPSSVVWVFPTLFEEIGACRVLLLRRLPFDSFEPLSAWPGRLPETLVLEVAEEDASNNLLEWLGGTLDDQSSILLPKLTLRFSGTAAQKVKQEHWEKVDRLLMHRTKDTPTLESLDTGADVEDMLKNRLPRVLQRWRQTTSGSAYTSFSASPLDSKSRKSGYVQSSNDELQ
ncbi:hypothetical protein BDZ89DRAFT_1130907 [Hymenopellis radicata]|nr:hypothetical protein BDZ89DRAFT_1130907 [Hymenopellis radicata]